MSDLGEADIRARLIDPAMAVRTNSSLLKTER